MLITGASLFSGERWMCGLLSVAKWLLVFLPPEDTFSSVHHQMPTSSYSDLFYCTVLRCNGTWLAKNCHVARLAAHFYNLYTQLSLDSQFIKVHHVVCVTTRAGCPWHRGSIYLVSFHLLIPLLDINHPVQHASQTGPLDKPCTSVHEML